VISTSDADTTAIVSYLAGFNAIVTSASYGLPTLRLNASVLTVGWYRVTLSVTNFLGARGDSDHVFVRVVPQPLPVVSIFGTFPMQVVRSDYVTLLADASPSSCSASSVKKLSYTWTVNGTSRSWARSTSRDPRYLKLAPYTLNISTTYVFTIKATDGTGYSNTASAIVSVVPQPLVVSIQGTGRTIGVGSRLTLKAGDSYDPDTPGVKGKAAGISFTWSCMKGLEYYGRSCGILIPPGNSTLNVNGLLSGKYHSDSR